MKSFKQLLESITKARINEGEENKGWKYKALEPSQEARTRSISSKTRKDEEEKEKQRKEKDIESTVKKAKETEGKAQKWGLPTIESLAKKQGKVVDVSVDGHDKDGMIAWHPGNNEWHFKHPSGRYYTGVELDKSGMGIAVKPKPRMGQRVIRPIAILPASRDAIESTTHIMGGKISKKGDETRRR